MNTRVQLEPSWKAVLANEFTQEYFVALTRTIREKYLNEITFPPPALVFHAFERCPFHHVSVVILGQDPYHGSGQAHGLAFSVPDGVSIPPSLQNIYKELRDDIGTPVPTNGNLEHWSDQGVLLLNTTLTVAKGMAGSHRGLGWETFTNVAIHALSTERSHLVFLLWGKHAQEKRALIDEQKHLVLTAPHPSPFSAHSGFFGCRHFSQTNAYLVAHGRAPIEW